LTRPGYRSGVPTAAAPGSASPDRNVPGVSLTVSRPRPAVVVVAIRGDLDLATHHAVRACLDEQRRDPALAHLVIDVAEVGFLQSIGIALLIDTQQSMPAHQQVALLGVSHNRLVHHVLDITGVLPRFTKIESVQDLTDPSNPPDPTDPITV